MTTVCILNGKGDSKLTWDPNDPGQVEAARQQVEGLKAQGYVFFLADNRPADEVAAGQGELLVKRLEPGQVVEAEPEAESQPEPEGEGQGGEGPKRRGRPRKVVAVPAMRGG